MQIIEFRMSLEDYEAIQNAGITIRAIEGRQLLPEGIPAVEVMLDQDVIKLLSPPICPWCMGMMNSTVGRGGLEEGHDCPSCGGAIETWRYPPAKEKDGARSKSKTDS